ncbi:hypothetical protein BKA93DRAFT_343182 [Sparassis latifolia]|uniref:Uncharacterized protein n=1 Tax=Sparassis crispa TaxID=139825 RepID=A0A401GX14_9APHY|nr:hypothetical protein SCP_1000030 [Sparassis crispa]GBE86761.1 hypothetical protein SCP_1000030 [Sparassis crispa]
MAEPTKGHKRKRSLQDTPVDLSKMRMARQRLAALKEELADIQETEDELAALMEHVNALEVILNAAKKPKLSFSSTTQTDLKKLGVVQKRLFLIPDSVASLAEKMTPFAIQECGNLQTRILEIYEHVNMDYEPGSRMILDAVLLSFAKIASQERPNQGVAILPEMRIATGEGVQIVNPVSQYELWLTGNVDYAVMQYLDEWDNKERLLGDDTCRDFALEVTEGRLFLVEAKRLRGEPLSSFLPEAVSQAIALSKLTTCDVIRFCLSNGQAWIFCILKKDQNEDKWIYYQATARSLSRDHVQTSDRAVREIIQLVSEWLVPTDGLELYKLMG